MLRSMGSQTNIHNCVTELTELKDHKKMKIIKFRDSHKYDIVI